MNAWSAQVVTITLALRRLEGVVAEGEAERRTLHTQLYATSTKKKQHTKLHTDCLVLHALIYRVWICVCLLCMVI